MRVSPGRAVWAALAIALAGFLLYRALRGIDWYEVWRVARSADPGRLAVAVAITTLALFLRACRWRVLLQAGGPVGLWTAFRATAMGYFGNNLLPARAGELLRTYAVSSQARLDAAFVLATALSERMADAIVLAAVGLLAALSIPDKPAWLAERTWAIASIAAAGVAAVAILPLLESLVISLVRRAPLPTSLAPRIEQVLSQALRGIRSFHDVRRFAAFLGFTAAIWSLEALGVIVVAGALGLQMPLTAALLLLAGLGFGSALPSTPGYVGIYQFVAVTILVPFGFSRADAIAYILVAQALNYLVITVFGGLAILRHRPPTAAS